MPWARAARQRSLSGSHRRSISSSMHNTPGLFPSRKEAWVTVQLSRRSPPSTLSTQKPTDRYANDRNTPALPRHSRYCRALRWARRLVFLRALAPVEHFEPGGRSVRFGADAPLWWGGSPEYSTRARWIWRHVINLRGSENHRATLESRCRSRRRIFFHRAGKGRCVVL